MARLRVLFMWPSKTASQSPVSIFQILIVESLEAETTFVEDKAFTQLTVLMKEPLLCPASFAFSFLYSHY